MSPDDRRLRRHLLTAVTVKLVALVVLWWLFFQEQQAPRGDPAATTSDHILGTSPRQGEPL